LESITRPAAGAGRTCVKTRKLSLREGVADEAIHENQWYMDCFAPLAMTKQGFSHSLDSKRTVSVLQIGPLFRCDTKQFPSGSGVRTFAWLWP